MASHVVVIDTTFRRATIKVTPGKYMSDVLEEACAKLNLKASNYGLKHNNKPLDTSRTFRQTNLSSGAKLELVVASKSPSVVSVALQLPESDAKLIPGGRLIEKFPSNTTLWLILRAFETRDVERNLNFTGRGVARTDTGGTGAGRIYYETPVLNIMGREISSFVELQKTLAQLGLNSGSSLIRLGFKVTNTPLEEAVAEIGQYFKPANEPVDSSARSGTSIAAVETVPEAEGSSATEDMAKNTNSELPAPLDTAMEIDPPADNLVEAKEELPIDAAQNQTPQTVPEEVVIGPNQRPISVFAAPSSETPKAALQSHNEADYEPTIAHAKLHQQRLLSKSQNQRLPSDAEAQALAQERAAKQAAIKEVSIKVRFPDQLTVVSSFTPVDSGAALHEFVRGVIVAEDQPFALVWMSPKGPQTIPNDAKIYLIKDLGFGGRMLVNFHWEDGASESARNATTLKGQFASNAKQLQVQEIAAAEAQVEGDEAAVKLKEEKKEGSGNGKAKGGVPKWLKLPGKK